MNTKTRPCVRAAIAAAVLGVVSIGAFAQSRDRDPSWQAPSEVRDRVNPLASHPEAAAGGAKLFHQRCATCHGEDARGTAKGPNLTSPDVLAETDGELYWKITTGNTREGMPSFSFVPEPQRWQLVLHLRSDHRR